MSAITTTGLTKRFGDVVAVDDLDLTVDEGEVYALVGPNGSGKTTILNALLGFIHLTSGNASILGHDVSDERLAIRRRIGVVPEGYGVYERLSGRRHVQFAADSKDVDDDPEALLERVGLDDVGDRPAGEYSNGMAKRLMLAAALVGDPDVLLFDEPFGGLDPRAAETLREEMTLGAESGTAVLFSSHVFSAVGRVCDRFGVLFDGSLIAERDVESLGETTLEEIVVRQTGEEVSP